MPFFGLTSDGKSLWAVGDGIYKIEQDGTAAMVPLGAFRQIGGIWVNFQTPGIVLVLTEISRATSVSGKEPLLVPR